MSPPELVVSRKLDVSYIVISCSLPRPGLLILDYKIGPGRDADHSRASNSEHPVRQTNIYLHIPSLTQYKQNAIFFIGHTGFLCVSMPRTRNSRYSSTLYYVFTCLTIVQILKQITVRSLPSSGSCCMMTPPCPPTTRTPRTLRGWRWGT